MVSFEKALDEIPRTGKDVRYSEFGKWIAGFERDSPFGVMGGVL
jgi:hypothetical protein